MKLLSRILTASLLVALMALVSASGAEKKKDGAADAAAAKGRLVPAKDLDPAWVARERKNYPLNVCLSSDEKLGDPSETAVFAYREAGKPDRLVLFCCDGCSDDFMKEADKCLAKLDAAAKAKAKKK